MIYRLYLWACAAICAVAVTAMVATDSEGLESLLYEDLTCEELVFSYSFNREVLEDIIKHYDGCIEYLDSPILGSPHSALGCMFLREHGVFVQGIVNDIAAVYNIKCADK